MGLEKEDDTDQTSTEDLAAQAAFDESFDGISTAAKPEGSGTTEAAADKPAAETQQANAIPAKEPEAAAQPAADQPATEAAPSAPIQKPDDQDLRLEMRKLHGRIGALNDQLQQSLKKNEAEGKPAVLSTVKLERLKAEYPEIADILEADLMATMTSISQREADPKAIEEMVSKRVAERVAEEAFAMRKEAVTDRHPNWKTDCWADKPGGTRTAEYQAWISTMPADEADAFENSQNPSFVNRKLAEFYTWKETAAKAATEKQQRLKAAVTPQGTPRAGPQTIPDEEAERKAFEEEFNR